MKHRVLDDAERAMFEAARATLDRGFDPQLHQVAAAVRGRSGVIYTGLHLGSRRVNICAESSAIANAVMAQDLPIRGFIAVCRDGARTIVTNPCGVCRELMTEYGQQARVVIDLRGRVCSVAAADLLPNEWRFPSENSWSVEDVEDSL